MKEPSYLIRRPEINEITGLSVSTIYRLEKSGGFPKRRQISNKSVAWVLSEIEEWIKSRAPVAKT